MKIIVVGAGVVGQSLAGQSLAGQLSHEGHQIVVIDSNRQKIRRLKEKMDVLAICGDGASTKILSRAGINAAEMVIAVTNVDEINLVIGMLASRSGAKHRIVRIRNPEYAEPNSVLDLQQLGIGRIINASPAIVHALRWMIQIPGSGDFANLAEGQVIMLGFPIIQDSPIAGKTIAQIRQMGEVESFMILYLTREGKTIIPRGDIVIEPGDEVHFLISTDEVQFLLPMVYRNPRRVRRVIISGGSRVGVQLAESIAREVERVFLIEPDRDRAEEVAAQLENTIVLHGDSTRLDILEEANLRECDMFCAVSDNDKHNMLSVLLAKNHSSATTAVLVHESEYVPVMNSLGVRIVLSPRLITVGEILMHIRRGYIHSITKLAENRGEILEMGVSEKSYVVNKALKDLQLPRESIVGTIIRDGVMKIPQGDTSFQAGDAGRCVL